MTTEITWLGHASWSIKTDHHTIVVDPYLDDSPTASVKSDAVEADFILVSHGHYDHITDVPSIANRTGATVVANLEIIRWLTKEHGVENVVQMNIGGGVDLPFGRVKMTQAVHSSQLPDGSYGGEPSGFLLSFPEGNVYIACDTALFSDMQRIGQPGLELAVLPIGDVFTMGPEDSIEAVRLLQPRRVIPMHYNTWPQIEQNVAQWAEQVRTDTQAEPLVMEPGETISL